ncbi:MAG TPA: NAD-dependent epimerase/dehydratase family protein [Polyangiaceae bacterium]|nr:NAD-dependent epimerase/dehydratase family protein [Polyangiaceae bacterium]
MKVLITGIGSRMGQLMTHLLLEAGDAVIGIDRRPVSGAPEGVALHRVDIRKRDAEEVFRTERPEAVVHLATMAHLHEAAEDRHRINLWGTKAVFDWCDRYGVAQAIFVGRHTYYGAAPDTPLYHQESDPPLGLDSFPELADLVAADLYAGSALWRLPRLKTAILRVCYTLGAAPQGTLAAYFGGRRVPTVLGFDPLFQVIHDTDAARAIVAALRKQVRGVYNVAGPPPLPLSHWIAATGRQRVPLPERLLALSQGRFGLPRLERGAIRHLKYPVVIDASEFQRVTGFVAEHDAAAIAASFRDVRPSTPPPRWAPLE